MTFSPSDSPSASMDTTELYFKLGDEEVLVVDCRSPDDWARLELHIPGALWMPVTEMETELHVLPDDELIVVYGSAPDGADVQRAIQVLEARGRNGVALAGGLHAWISDGYPTAHHSPLENQPLAHP